MAFQLHLLRFLPVIVYGKYTSIFTHHFYYFPLFTENPGCKLLNTTTIISQSECTATVPIELTYCEGNCPASSM